MKILITGGAGYIGSVLTPKLLRKGYDVTVVDNFMYKQNSLLSLCSFENFNIINGDSRDKQLMSMLIREHDVIIPLACLTGAPACERNPSYATSTNFEAIKMISNLSSSNQIILYPNTNSGYGIGQGAQECTEDSPLKPISHYGKVKVAAEEVLMKKTNAIVFRLATVFGASPRMRIDLLVNDFVYKAVTDHSLVIFESHFKRNYLYIGDCADTFIYCIENYDFMKNEIYNVGLNKANLSKEELCIKIKKQIPEFEYVKSDFSKDPDQRNYTVSNDKLISKGFRAQTTLEQGIKELLKAYSMIKECSFRNY